RETSLRPGFCTIPQSRLPRCQPELREHVIVLLEGAGDGGRALEHGRTPIPAGRGLPEEGTESATVWQVAHPQVHLGALGIVLCDDEVDAVEAAVGDERVERLTTRCVAALIALVAG